MEVYVTNSTQHIERHNDRDKAWTVFSVLLRIGHPVRLDELAARCGFFRLSPDFVEFLCSIPDSPLLLTDDKFVTISLVAISAVGGFASINIINFLPHLTIRVSGSKRLLDDVRAYFRKRKGRRMDEVFLPPAKRRLTVHAEFDNQGRFPYVERMVRAPSKTQVNLVDIMRNMSLVIGSMPVINYEPGFQNQVREMIPFLLDADVDIMSYGLMKIEHIKNENEAAINITVHRKLLESVHTPEYLHSLLGAEINPCPRKARMEGRILNYDSQSPPQPRITESQELCIESGMDSRNKTWSNDIIGLEENIQFDAFPVEDDIPGIPVWEAGISARLIDATETCKTTENLKNSENTERDPEDVVLTNQTQELLRNDLGSMDVMYYNDEITFLDKEKAICMRESKLEYASEDTSPNKTQPASSSSNMRNLNRDTSNQGQQVPDSLDTNSPKQEEQCTEYEKGMADLLDYNNVEKSPTQQKQYIGDEKCMSIKQKSKQNPTLNFFAKENKTESTAISPKLGTKALPNFKSFIIEEEEGSGGYGTVYRARRKNDGKTFAIKCPHVNAHIHHVNNERKMLERFGGRNFVIKFESSFKSSSSECFVLEHVEHDRPEVLRKEIDIFQLQWYGYCMFRALASLHKQGIVHRDVKPGNFLFSRKLNKGYLIDFNLAMDLNQKYSTTSKSKMSCSESADRVHLPSNKAEPSTKSGTVMGRLLGAASRTTTKEDSKTSLEPKNTKKIADVGHSKAYQDLGSRHKLKIQGTDGSGLTSTKDATTPSAERRRQPLPSTGRKELLSLAEKAMQRPNHKAASVPASHRKRVAAPPEKVDRRFFYLTPMPVQSTGTAVAGAGLLKNKGDGKQKKEGPCVGTKGFRAPEVLFRSPHQGPKVDIWSAGVNLLYLMTGRTPFVGDPEQNIKDIAKLRGSEDLWEVAKLHNRESSFPVELLDIQFLQSKKLQEWCKMYTKRSDFFDLIPSSLFDLVDKCLTVNPRLRISAEEALNHDFFAPCHDAIRRQRHLRLGVSLDSVSSQFSHE